jgi:hypothetical protein
VAAAARARLPEPALRSVRSARRLWWRTTGRLAQLPAQPPRPPIPATPVRLLVGPANFAGQGWAWGRAAQDRLPGVGTVVMAVRRSTLNFAADYLVDPVAYRHPTWGAEQRRWLGGFTHVLDEAVRPLTGRLAGDTCARELPWLRQEGVAVALVAHGSEIRLPSLHRELYPFSPFDPADPATRSEQEKAERCRPVFVGFDGPTFVSTPDLLDFAPDAAWLPVVVDPAPWAGPDDVLVRRRPVVLHVPSNRFLKGTRHLEPVLSSLHERGVIEYRQLTGVPAEEMPALVRDADVVVDQVVLGQYGVTAIQGMLAGKVVLAHVADRVRARVPLQIPIVEATPDNLLAAVTAVLDDRDGHRALAAAGRAYALRVHDGAMSAAVLAGFLGLDQPAAAAPG